MRVEMSKIAVYTHSNDGVVFYVGMGVGQRAFELTRRNGKWNEIVKKNGGFDVCVVSWLTNRDDAARLEAEEIRRLKPEANLMMNGFSRSDSFKQNMSNRLLGVKKSEETRKKMSEGMKGRTAHNKGKPLSEEQKTKLSELATGKLGVVDAETGERFRSVRDAVQKTGIPRTTLRSHLNGKLKHAGARLFKYG